MSSRLIGAVFYLDLPRGLKLVLAALADHADDDGSSCYPSVSLLAQKASATDRQVRRDVADLEARGYLSRSVNAAPDERIPVDRRPNDYLLDADRIAREAAANRAARRPVNGRTPTSARGRTPTSEREDIGGQNGRTPTSAKTSERQPPGKPAGGLSTSRPTASQVVEWWNDEMGDVLPKALATNGTRGRHIQARCRIDGRDESWWRAYFAAIRATPFLLGDNDRGWKASIDFAVRSEDSVNKVREGNYGGSRQARKRSTVMDAWDEIERRLDDARRVEADQQGAVLGLPAGEHRG